MSDDVISLHDDDGITDAEVDRTSARACLIPNVDVTQAKFPSSFYAVDVHTAFTFRTTGKLTVEAQFMCFFDLPWKPSMYYHHKAQWFDTPRDARDNAVAAGHSDAGRYSVFLEAHPAKDAELNTAKRRLLASQCN